MYQVVQKLKRLKPILRAEAWKSGNLCKKVGDLKSNLLNIQSARDSDPFNEEFKIVK